MNFLINKEIKILSLAFFFIFIGFNGVQQYVTSFFSEAGIAEVGFLSLILIYFFITLSEPFSALFVSKYGAKKSMIIGSFFYFLFIISLTSRIPYFIYITSAMLGFGASLLWMGQGSFLIRASDEKSYGKNSGFFDSFLSLGSIIGIVSFGFLAGKILFNNSFFLFSIFPIIGILLIINLKDFQKDNKINRFRFIRKAISNITLLKISIFYFSVQFIFGLVIGIIPIQIKNVLGISYIGVLSSLFFISPVLFSYLSGRLSDIKGRKKMIILSYTLIIISLIFIYFLESSVFLILSIILIAINSAIIRPISFALIGDISTKRNLEFIIALFWIFQNLGVVSALFISRLFIADVKNIYLLSIFVTVTSFIFLIPFLKSNLGEIKERLSREIS